MFVNDRIIKENGRRIQKEYNERVQSQQQSHLNFSNGWISRFKYRNKLRAYKCHSESGTADEDAMSRELPNLRALIAEYNPKDVFNADKFGLFYKQGPNVTAGPNPLKVQKDKKNRSTYLECTNIDGTGKHLPMVIGRSEKPQCFKGLSDQGYNIDYKFNRRTWMRCDLFSPGSSSLTLTLVRLLIGKFYC